MKLSEGGRNLLLHHATNDPEAYDLYRQGQFYWNKFNEAGARRSIELFSSAIAKDPQYAEAYAGLSWAYAPLAYLEEAPTGEIIPQARKLARQALQLDPGLPQALVADASIKLIYDWDFTKAEAELRRALDLNGGFADAYYF